MNDPITIPETSLIMNAALLTYYSSGSCARSQFTAAEGVSKAQLPCGLFEVHSMPDEEPKPVRFPTITPKLAVYAVYSLIDQIGGHLTGETWKPDDDFHDFLQSLITDYHFILNADEFCEFCGGSLAGKAKQADRAIRALIDDVFRTGTSIEVSGPESGIGGICHNSIIGSVGYSSDDYAIAFEPDLSDRLIMRYQYGQTMTIPAGFLRLGTKDSCEMILALLLLDKGTGADREICLIDIQSFMERWLIWPFNQAGEREVIDRLFNALTEAGFLTGYDYDDGGSDYWKRAVISYHLNI